jgi:hypothetical protein
MQAGGQIWQGGANFACGWRAGFANGFVVLAGFAGFWPVARSLLRKRVNECQFIPGRVSFERQ